jgi:DNA-binding XRE family transcriptional regulator
MTSDQNPQARSEAEAAKARLKNNVRRLREDRLLTKAELARKAGVSTLTIDRVEAGMPCRMDTKRKIILALGMTVAEKDQVFVKGEDNAEADVDDDAVTASQPAAASRTREQDR